MQAMQAHCNVMLRMGKDQYMYFTPPCSTCSTCTSPLPLQDPRVPAPRLEVLDLEAHRDVTLRRYKEQYKTAKYLLKEDASLCSA